MTPPPPADATEPDAPPGTLPVPAPATAPAVPDDPDGPLSKRERDYLMLSILVRLQHLRHDEADVIADGMEAMGEGGPDLHFARAVIAYAREDFETVLSRIRQLDRIDPPDLYASRRADGKVRIRSFMKARATFALKGELDEEARAALDYYLRRKPRGAAGPGAPGPVRARTPRR
ncbi:MAG: hypothetical protein ACU0BF_00635 [Paracoccaceae bacterium]